MRSERCVLVRAIFLFSVMMVPFWASAATHAVEIHDSFFSPSSLTIEAGDTVVWTWVGGVPHSTTSDDDLAQTWDSGVHTGPASFEVTFTEAGEFPYGCSVHLGMRASLSVVPAGMELTPVDDLVSGDENLMVIDGATASADVASLASLGLGETAIPGCPGVFLGLERPRLIDRRDADDAGSASFDLFLPPSMSGRAIWTQAVDLDACVVSEPLKSEIR
jgi:plastocyanin